MGWCGERVSVVCSLVRSFVGRGHKSSRVWSSVCCARKGPCCFCRLQIENPDYRRRTKKMTEFPFSCYAQRQRNDQQRRFFLGFGAVEIKSSSFDPGPCCSGVGVREVWGWAAVSRITSNPCRSYGTPAWLRRALSVARVDSVQAVFQKRLPLPALGMRQIVTQTWAQPRKAEIECLFQVAKRPRITD